MCFVTRNAKLSKFINNENFCKKEKKEKDRSRDVTGMVDNMHSNLTPTAQEIAMFRYDYEQNQIGLKSLIRALFAAKILLYV